MGLVWTFVLAVAGASVMRAMFPALDGYTFGSLLTQWLDTAPVCLISPFIVAVLFDPPNLIVSIRKRPFRAAAFVVTCIVLAIVPLAMVAAIPKFAISSSIVGLYITWPLVGLLAAFAGLKGATFGVLVAGLASILIIPFRTYSGVGCQMPVNEIRRDNLFWTQICVLIECLASLIFNLVLSQAERARQSIECEVRIRTEELEQAKVRAEQAKARAEQADKNRALFVHFLCHELRNPLHAMSNLIELLIDERALNATDPKSDMGSVGVFTPINRPSAPAPANLSKDAGCAWSRSVDTTALISDPGSDPMAAISLCTNYMLSLLSDTLDVGRFENGAVKLEKRPTDLYSLLEEVSAMAKARANSKRLTFRLEVAPDVPQWAEVDPLRLQQVINNLISNSFKFTPAGGSVTLTVDISPVEAAEVPQPALDSPSIITIEHDDPPSCDTRFPVPFALIRRATVDSESPTFRLRIRCIDTGVGIPPESLATLFDPWTQAARSTSAEYGGSGLGLSIAAQIVELFEGQIRAESEVGIGTTFIFELPLKIARPDAGYDTRVKQTGISPVKAVPSTSSFARSSPVRSTPLPSFPDHPKLSPLGPNQSVVRVGNLSANIPPARMSTPSLVNGPIGRPRTRRILVTDDSAINRKILVRMLAQSVKKLFPGEEFVVEEAENGKEAVDMVTKNAESDKEFELIFMDVVMPVMDGFAATREIRRIPDISPHIIFASANQMDTSDGSGINPEWLRAGGDDALIKPFGRAAVEELLQKYCSLPRN